MPRRKSVKRKVVTSKNSSPEPKRESQDQLLSSVRQLTGWLVLHHNKLATGLTVYDQLRPGITLWADFTISLTTLGAPVTHSVLSLLQPHLAPDNTVDMTSLHSDLHSLQRQLTLERKVPIEPFLGDRCEMCGLRLPPPPTPDTNSKYVELHLQLGPFVSTPSHPGHLVFSLPTSTTIHSLQLQLSSSLPTSPSKVTISSDTALTPLAPHHSLIEVGVVGGEKATPTKATLYYNFTPVQIFCPLLMTSVST